MPDSLYDIKDYLSELLLKKKGRNTTFFVVFRIHKQDISMPALKFPIISSQFGYFCIQFTYNKTT